MKKNKIQDMELTHRNLNVLMKYKDGFAPVWDVYVRWPGYKNRKYFCLIPTWNRLPSACIDVAFAKIDAELGLAWVDITTMDSGTRRYIVKNVTNEGNFVFKELSIENRHLRFNQKEGRVEFLIPDSNGKWDVFISNEDIVQVNMWNRS